MYSVVYTNSDNKKIESGRSNRCWNKVTSGFLPFTMSEFFSGVKRGELKNTSFANGIFGQLLLCY